MATVKGTQVGPFDFGYLELAPPAYDPAQAKALLAEAGYPDGFAIDMQVVRRYTNGAEVGQAIAQQLGEIGVKVTLHPLGTDQLGRDLLARIFSGARISLGIVLFAGAISALLGTVLGLIAGYFRGWVDAVIMRLVDIQLAIPFILLILLVVAVVGPSIVNLILVLGVTGWAIFARVARARALEIRELEYIAAAKALGLPTWRILLKHMLPNILVPQIVLLTLDLPRLVVLEASIGFLGLGVQPPTPTLGNLIGEGRSFILFAEWLDRGPVPRLRPHRPRQGAVGTARNYPPCAAQRADTGGYRSGHVFRSIAGRRPDHGDYLRLARHRQAGGPGHPEPGFSTWFRRWCCWRRSCSSLPTCWSISPTPSSTRALSYDRRPGTLRSRR